MTNSTKEQIPQFWVDAGKEIHLHVAFASEDDEKAFSSQPEAEKIHALVRGGITMTGSAFVTNGLLRDQKSADGYRDRAELARFRLGNRLEHFLEYFSFEDGTVRARYIDEADSDKAQTEYLGVAGAISVTDRIFELTTEADWSKIPVSNKSKTLDFWQVAIDGGPVTLEAKGRLKRKGLSKALNDIKAKKAQTPPQPGERQIGVTTVPAYGKSTVAKCYLSDPPGEQITGDAFKYKLVRRLNFYAHIMSMFSYSFVLQSLSQRIADLKALGDYYALNKVYLIGRSGRALAVPQSMGDALGYTSRMEIVGDFFSMGRGHALLFIGLRRDLVEIVLSQDF